MVINQQNNIKQLKFIIIHSKKITNIKLNYKIYNKELLTIINIFKK